MNIKISLRIEADDGSIKIIEDVAQLERGPLTPTNLGLTLAESKQILQGIQQEMVSSQVSQYVEQQAFCPDCGQPRKCKGKHKLIYRSVFGKLTLTSPRFFHCPCQSQATKSFSPLALLLTERQSPEYLYLQTKFASLVSYGLSVQLLDEVLPLNGTLNPSTVRYHLHQMGQKLDDELGEEQIMYVEGSPRQWEQLPRPELPLNVGIDGAYIHAHCSKGSKQQRHFELIVGKSIPDEGPSKSFGFVQTYDTKPKRRLFELLKSQGMQMNQQVTFFSDGGDTVRDLQRFLNPQAEYLLDWFHVTMRITQLSQYLRGLKHYDLDNGKSMVERLKSVKWYLWHGNVFRALQELEWLEEDADFLESNYPKLKKMRRAIAEFHTYIQNNGHFIPNYGERYRCGERISTGFVESTVNQVVAKRMEKKQQMRWTPKGAHLLLQVRTKVLNQDWKEVVDRWYSPPLKETGVPNAA
ncbi:MULTISPECIES: ISKra4-like element ISSysp7 family transposase [Cyanophyceae]|uniref:ISKra4-like element ISSysp7 family transposase n=1 Tax=Cyanophyceae TaxID=3028117 RepID=UPI00016DC3BB|nr:MULTISPECIES: ISKra4-like element ISSysp7 family transposase [Cyanophyceae]ACB00945.1 conserved hypothetical protein [Picosynechococcus sp. PCC 7002]ACB01081.1 hypothetical protein SYNPCC7002_G0041 [Picosynechococcus sp. PCC 7002]SMH42205.1 hypothetical protein SAMN06272755_1281 [Picosynechococcus sp. OG1]SMH47085.1 hypothetical protein SAMN06272755_1746 [Picosynechococcus sp. OG1]SMH47630.1 hypothetical protein SAMN06272755_1804 [Picosynechococcus sp. OG1]